MRACFLKYKLDFMVFGSQSMVSIFTNLFHSDTCIVRLQQTLNSELIKLSHWFQANKLSLNVGKTNYRIFGFKVKVCKPLL